MRLVQANEATASRRRVYFQIVDATDGLTAETGEDGGQPQVSSDGGAWTDTGIGVLVAIGNGRYYAELTQALVATAGTVIETRYKSAETAEAVGDQVAVVGWDPATSYATAADVPSAAAVADAVWDETLPGAHTTNNTAGKLLIKAQESTSVRDGTLQAGSTASTAVLDSGASAVNNYYDHNLMVITGGAGAGQVRTLHDYVGSTKVATVIPNWATTPDGTSTFEILAMGKVDAYELSDPANALIAAAVRSELATELAHLDADVSSASAPSAASVADAVWDEALSGHAGAGTAGATLTSAGAGSGSGANTVTITLVDGDGAYVGSAVVQVRDSGDSTLLAQGTTAADDGSVSLALDDGSYKVRIATPPGYSIASPQDLAVSGNTDEEYTATKLVAETPSDPSLCRVSGVLRDASGDALASTAIYFVAYVPQSAGGATMASQSVSATTGTDGSFYVDLVQGATVVISCTAAGHRATQKTVPSSASQDFSTW